MLISVGDWVKVKGYVKPGYVERMFKGTETGNVICTVMIPTKANKFKPVEDIPLSHITLAEIEGMGDVSTRFKKDLIEWTLADRDEEWFKEVINHKSFM